MKTRFPRQLPLLIAVSWAGHAFAERTWADAETGREYVLLDGEVTWNEAMSACTERGYALYDARNVTDGEAKALIASELLSAVPWETHFAGSTQEMKVATIWQTAEEMIIATGGSFGARMLLIQKKRAMTSTAYEWRNEDEHQASAICMSVPGFWYRCSMEVKCTYDRGANEYSWRYLLADYGGGEGDVMRNIMRRTQEAPFAISEGSCVPRTESAHCLRVMPEWSPQ